MRSWGRPTEEGLRIEAELVNSMWMRHDKHSDGARAFLEKQKPTWEHHGL